MCVQLVDNEEGSETTALSRMGRQLRYMLSMGHRIHELEAAAPYTQVSLTRTHKTFVVLVVSALPSCL